MRKVWSCGVATCGSGGTSMRDARSKSRSANCINLRPAVAARRLSSQRGDGAAGDSHSLPPRPSAPQPVPVPRPYRTRSRGSARVPTPSPRSRARARH
eukprot:3881700-Prymnesium_polylepis.1